MSAIIKHKAYGQDDTKPSALLTLRLLSNFFFYFVQGNALTEFLQIDIAKCAH